MTGALATDIPTDAPDLVRIQVITHQGTELVDIRVWAVLVSGDGDELVATKKGVCFSREQLPRVIEALQKIANAVPVGAGQGD